MQRFLKLQCYQFVNQVGKPEAGCGCVGGLLLCEGEGSVFDQEQSRRPCGLVAHFLERRRDDDIGGGHRKRVPESVAQHMSAQSKRANTQVRPY